MTGLGRGGPWSDADTMVAAADLVKRAVRRMGFQLTRLGSSATAPSVVEAVAAPRGSTSAALSQAARTGRAPRTVNDVGAAFGECPQQCFRVFPDAAYPFVESLEEYRPNLDRLKADIPRASVVWAAAAGHEGMRDINVHPDLVGSSLYMDQEDSAVNSSPRRIRTVSLNNVVASHRLEPPYLLKVDVQGAELDVLSGGEHVLRHVEWAMLEVSFFELFERASQFEDVFEFMRSRGFVVYDLLEPVYRPQDGALSKVNAMFVRREGALRRHHFYPSREQSEKQDRHGMRGEGRSPRTAGRGLRAAVTWGPPPGLLDYQRRPFSPSRLEGGRRTDVNTRHESAEGRPLVSIITTVRNGSATLERTIRSVQSQTYSPIEYIVIDGGSTDGTLEIIQSYDGFIDYWMSEPDAGMYDGINRGLAAATGRYVAILNSDDWLSSDQIELAVDSLLRSRADFVFGNIWMHGWEGRDVFMRGRPDYGSVIRHTLDGLFHTTIVCERELFERFGLFRTNLTVASDYDWLLRLHLHGCKGVYDPRIVGHMQFGGISTARQGVALLEGAIVSARNGYPAPLAAVRHMVRHPVAATWLRAVRRRVTGHMVRCRGIGTFARRSSREAQRVLIASARRFGLLPRLMDLPRIEKAVTDSGLYKPSRFLEAFVTARGLYAGLSELTLESVYGLGASLESVLCVDQSRRSRQVALMLEAGGAKVQDVCGTAGETGSALRRVDEFQGVIIGELDQKDRATELVRGCLSRRHTVIVSSPKDTGGADSSEVRVYGTPPAPLLRRDG